MTSISKKNLIVLLGPTAVGKTKLCVDIANRLKTEIIYADSRQVYRNMPICTAQPTLEEMESIKHHFVSFLDPYQSYDAALYASEVLIIMDSLFERYSSLILSGGTGLYIDAVCNGLDVMPSVDYELRNFLDKRLEAEGLLSLSNELALKDPVYYQIVDKKNHRRIIRALEVIYSTGKPFSEHRLKKIIKRPFNILKIGLCREKRELNERIDLRVDLMIENGLIEEANRMYEYRNCNSTQTIGYKELFEYFDSKKTLDEAILDIKNNTRHYAKRQMTWFKRDKSIKWYHPDELEKIFHLISEEINKV